MNAVAYIKADNKVCCIPAMSGLPGTVPGLPTGGTITPCEFQMSSQAREEGEREPLPISKSGSSGASS